MSSLDETIKYLGRIADSDQEQYQRLQERRKKVDEVDQELRSTYMRPDQREAVAEALTAIFISPIKDPYDRG